jgi:4-amino-4-deoxy-L-arabinose transferase-like glycosyltransferase
LVVNSSHPDQFWEDDSLSYHDTARALLALGTFSISPENPGESQLMRTPGYPVFLALVYALFGIHTLPVIFFQIAISGGTLWLTDRAACKLWGSHASTLAAGLLAIDLTFFTLSGKLLTETLFIFWIALAVVAIVQVFSSSALKKGWALTLGASVAAATLVRPVSYYLIFLMLIGCLLYGSKQKWVWQNRLKFVFLVAIPWMLLVGGWQVRNWVVSGKAEFSSIQGINLLYYRTADVIALRDGISLDEARRELDLPRSIIAGSHESELKTGLMILARYPHLAVLSWLRGVAKMLIIPGETTFLRYLGIPEAGEQGVIGDLLRLKREAYFAKWLGIYRVQFFTSILVLVYLGMMYAGFIAGFISAIRDQPQNFFAHLFLAGILVYFLIVSAGPEAYARFRVPLLPVFALYASQAIRSWINLPRLIHR